MRRESDAPAEHWLRGPEAEAAFSPSDGFNCTAFRARLLESGSNAGSGAAQDEEGWVAALAEAPNWEALRVRPSFFGNPLLFPFAYGVKEATLRPRGAAGPAYVLAPTRWGRVAHGLVRDAAWQVEREWADGDGAHLRGSITTAGEPERLAEYPFPFRLAVTYTLVDRTLKMAIETQNLGDESMPFGFGIHPYLPAPLGTLGRAAEPEGPLDDVVYCDATHADPSGPMPGGTPHRLAPADGAFDLRRGQTFASLLAAQKTLRNRDGLFLTYANWPGGDAPPAGEGAGLHWSLESRRLGVAVEIAASPELWGMVLFAPPSATVISPVIGTCLPGFLDYPDDAETSRRLGRLEIAPGATWTANVSLRVKSLA